MERRASRPVHIPDMAFFSTEDVAGLFGLSLRQLQWWDEIGFICPDRDGRNRAYTRKDVLRIAIVANLLQKGATMPMLRRVLSERLSDIATECVSKCRQRYLVTDGRSASVVDPSALGTLTGANFVLDLSSVITKD